MKIELVFGIISLVISFSTLIIIIWYTLYTKKQVSLQRAGLGEALLLRHIFDINRLLAEKGGISNKKKLFKEIYLPPNAEKIEGIKIENFNDEEIEIGAFIMINFSLFEYLWGAKENKILEKKYWEDGWIPTINEFFKSKRVKKVWDERKNVFQKDFREWIDSKVIKKKNRG